MSCFLFTVEIAPPAPPEASPTFSLNDENAKIVHHRFPVCTINGLIVNRLSTPIRLTVARFGLAGRR